jgi:hypothetical protein
MGTVGSEYRWCVEHDTEAIYDVDAWRCGVGGEVLRCIPPAQQ